MKEYLLLFDNYVVAHKTKISEQKSEQETKKSLIYYISRRMLKSKEVESERHLSHVKKLILNMIII